MATLEIHTVNVGQGDCAFLVVRDGRAIKQLVLVDAGSANGAYYTDTAISAATYWEKNFGRKVDKVIISHWDEDHYGGLPWCIERGMFRGDSGCPLYSPAEKRKTGRFEYAFDYVDIADAAIPFPIYTGYGVQFVCYANGKWYEDFSVPVKSGDGLGSPQPTATNISSLIILVTYDNKERFEPFRYYTGGDINQENEDGLVENLNKYREFLNSMKVSHHGSETSTPDSFLKKANPGLAIISANSKIYDHPSKSVLTRLSRRAVVTLKTNNGGNTEELCAAICGDGIKQIVSNDRVYVQFGIEPDQARRLGIRRIKPSSTQSYEVLTLRQLALGLRRSTHAIDPLLPDTPLGNLLKLYLASIPVTMASDGESCTIPSLPLHDGFDYMLTDCELRMNADGKTAHITAKWRDIPMAGTLDGKGHMSLANAGGGVKVPLMDLVRSAFGEQFDLFSMVPETLLPEITVSEVALEVDMGSPRAFQMAFTTKMGGDIAISREITLTAPTITLTSDFSETSEERGIHGMNIYLRAAVATRSRSLGVGMSFSSSPVWMVEIDPGSITMQDLLALVPSLSDDTLDRWCGWMGLKNITVERAGIGIRVVDGIELYSVEFRFDIKLFSKFPVLLGWTHLVGGDDAVFGEMDEVKLPELLMAAGVDASHIGFLPDVTLNACSFSSTPQSSSFDVSAVVSFGEPHEIGLGGLSVCVNHIGVEIAKTADSVRVALDIEGTLNGASIKLEAGYVKGEGFAFTGELQNMDVSHLLEAVFHQAAVVRGLDVRLSEVDFSMSKGDILFSADMPVIKFSDKVCLKESKVMVKSRNGQTAFSVGTRLEVTSDGKDFVASGEMAVSPHSIFFLAAVQTPLNDVLGIRGLDIYNLAICLSENMNSGLGIGLMGSLAFPIPGRTDSLNGDIALYFSPQNPGKELVAVNFNGISLLDIVSIFVRSSDGGVGKVLESIALEPVPLPDVQPVPTGDYAGITAYIDRYEKGKGGTYEIQTGEKYRWIPKGKVVIKNSTNYKTYELIDMGGGKCAVRKYVGMYACINPAGEGIVLNGVTFRPGFAFCARLMFLGMNAIVDFTAEPGRGIKLTAEMESALNVGKWLQICRVEDAHKGPVLSICTYPESFAFYLSAKIRILSLFEEQIRVAFADNRFAFMFYYNLLGFRASIQASGDVNELNGGGFALSIAFETNGFGEVTEAISRFLHQKADEINSATSAAADKLENARRTVAEQQRSLVNTQNQIAAKQLDLDNLRHTHYPWYKAYKYVALGIRIAAVAVEIGALAAYKLVVIGLIKTAEGVLALAEKAVLAAGAIAADALKIIGDVTAIVGKSIDWLIRLDRIEASLKLSAAQLQFDFDIRYQLCGSGKSAQFGLSSNGNLADTLIRIIRGGNDAKLAVGANGDSTLDSVYGPITEQQRQQIIAADWDALEKEFEKAAALGDLYTGPLDDMQKDLDSICAVLNVASNDRDSAPITVFSGSLTHDDIRSLSEDLDRAATACDALESLDQNELESDFGTLHAALTRLQAGQDMDTIRDFAAIRSKSLRWLDGSRQRRAVVGMAAEKAGDRFVRVSDNRTGNVIPSDDQKDAIIKRYQGIVDNPSVSDCSRAMFCEALSSAWKERANPARSKDFADKAIGLTTEIWGADSDELRALKDRLNRPTP